MLQVKHFEKGSVELTKIDDIDTDTKLANAVFNLLDADGEIVEEGLKQMLKENCC